MKKGFTILELLIVMVIIGSLATIGVASYTSSLSKARDAKRKADIYAIQAALEIYKQENGAYPVSIGWEISAATASTPRTGLWIPQLTAAYIKDLPIDPKNIGSTAPDVPGNYVYGYYSVTGLCPNLNGGEYYILAARLENSTDPQAKQVTVADNCLWPAAVTPGVFAITNP